MTPTPQKAAPVSRSPASARVASASLVVPGGLLAWLVRSMNLDAGGGFSGLATREIRLGHLTRRAFGFPLMPEPPCNAGAIANVAKPQADGESGVPFVVAGALAASLAWATAAAGWLEHRCNHGRVAPWTLPFRLLFGPPAVRPHSGYTCLETLVCRS